MKALILILSTFSVISEAKSFLPARINSPKPVLAERYQDSVYKTWKTEDFDENELSKQTLNMLQYANESIFQRFSDVLSFNSISSIQTRTIKETQQKQYYLTLKYQVNSNEIKDFYFFFESLDDQKPKVAAFNFQSDYLSMSNTRF
ncbi:hypothetical protein ABPG72_013011 [Tetrahymena utriculariae]